MLSTNTPNFEHLFPDIHRQIDLPDLDEQGTSPDNRILT